MTVHCLPNGRDVKAFSRMFNLDKYLAKEKMENGILSIVLHSMLIECTDVNWVGPPRGKELKLFLANDMVFRWTRLDRSPSCKENRKPIMNRASLLLWHRFQLTGNWATLFPSMLNSSSLEQLASDVGMAERRLYLIRSRLRFFRLPINSGRSTNSLWVKSSVVSWAQLPNSGKALVSNDGHGRERFHWPISFGRCSRWLCATSSVSNWDRLPTVIGNERIRFSLKLSICKF